MLCGNIHTAYSLSGGCIMRYWKSSAFFIPVVTALVSGCGATQYEIDVDRHITKESVSLEEPTAPSGVPDLVGSTAELPELYYEGSDAVFDIVVEQIDVRQVLNSLSDQAQIDMDVDGTVQGVVSLNAYDQTVDQILERIRKQLPIRYERVGDTIVVLPEDLYTVQYEMTFPDLARSYEASVDGSIPASDAGSIGSSAVDTTKEGSGSVWGDLEEVLEVILEVNTPRVESEVDRGPVASDEASAEVAEIATTLASRTAFLEKGEPYAHLLPDAGLIIVYAGSLQHKLVSEVIAKITEASRRQVLLQATVVEINLNNQYQHGIDWSIFNQASRGPRFLQSNILTSGSALQNPTQDAIAAYRASLTSAGITNTAQVNALVSAFANRKLTTSSTAQAGFLKSSFTVGDLDFAVSLLDRFGDTKVVSSPRISTLNGQGAILKVVEDHKYFTVAVESTEDDDGSVTEEVSVEEETIPIGFVVNAYPQIGRDGTIILSIRPSVSRIVSQVVPPTVKGTAGSPVPIVSVKEIETLMLLQDGQTGVMGGLIEDVNLDASTGVPGANRLPGIGSLFENKEEQTKRVEYVIFVSAKIVRNPTLHGDYSDFTDWLPSDETFSRDQSGSFFGNEVEGINRAR